MFQLHTPNLTKNRTDVPAFEREGSGSQKSYYKRTARGFKGGTIALNLYCKVANWYKGQECDNFKIKIYALATIDTAQYNNLRIFDRFPMDK